jgi:predicted unusual protein kinase regulating ubiquinone biosynthesis (AarF/ABC1/UbiB family)
MNKGVYARLGQILSGMTGVLPEVYLTELKKLNNIKIEEIPYEKIKNALTGTLNKSMKEVFDAFQPKPLNVGLLTQ